MLLKILGWFWVIFGILFLLKPDWLRNRLKKKSMKKIKRTLFGLALILGILLIKATWGIPGLFPKIIMAVGLVAILKAFFFLKAQAADLVIEWFLNQPMRFYRIWAVCQIAFGVLILKAG